MIQTGINYISSMSILGISGFIDTLKFPGIRCNPEELEQFLMDLPQTAQADLHGLINFRPAWNSPNIAQNANNDLNRKLLTQTHATHFSTHIGQFEGDGDPFVNFRKNLEDMRTLLPAIRLGGENVFSLVNPSGKANYMTLQSTHPDFINFMWERLDFGVFDIAHAKIAARDHKMQFSEYVRALNCHKVEIIHISGGMALANFNSSNSNDVDLHFPCELQDFIELQQLLKLFPNVKFVISELAYSKGENNQRVPLTQEDYEKEAQALNIAVKQNDTALYHFFEKI